MRPTAPHPLQYQSQAGFVLTLGLASFAGYFAWRESRTIAELKELVDRLPEITRVTHVPSTGDVGAVSKLLAAVPGSTGFTPPAS